MSTKKIFIVEDESIIALEIFELLKHCGFEQIEMAHSGEQAINNILEQKPDLVLLDISLKGKIDGIEVANEVHKNYDVPIIYITAYSDNATISRVKETQPYGFLIKPFNRKELATTIEIALIKFESESKIKESEAWLNTTLNSIGDAIVATDNKGCIKFANPIASKILNISHDRLIGERIDKIFHVHDLKSNIHLEDPISRILREKDKTIESTEVMLVTSDGTKIFIEEETTLISTDHNEVIGVVLIFRDITERKLLEEKKAYRNNYDKIISEISKGFVNLSVEEFDDSVRNALGKIGHFLNSDFSFIYSYSSGKIKRKYVWVSSPSIEYTSIHEINIHEYNWAREIILSGKSIAINDLKEIPHEGAYEKEFCNRIGVKSFISVPLLVNGLLLGIIGVVSVRKRTTWKDEDPEFIMKCGEVFLNAINKNIAQKELIESENKFRSLAEKISDGIIFYDFYTKNIMWANKAYCELSGYTDEELIQLRSYDIVAHEAKSMNELDQIITKNRKYFIGERKHKKKDGSIFDVEVNSALIDINHTEVMVVVVRDLTQRKDSEQLLRISEEQYRTLFTTMAQGVVYLDEFGLITAANPAACRILKIGLSELVGVSFFDYFNNAIHEDGSNFTREEFPSFISIHSGKIVNDTILGFEDHETNERRWISIDSVPEFREGVLNPYRIFSTFTDITDRKMNEEVIRKSEEQLRMINASKDKFFSIVAHDLKSPFLGLLGFSNALLENYDELDREQMRRYIANINKTTKNVYNLIQHLLEWSRIQIKRLEINIEELIAFNCAENAINLLLVNAANKEITVINNMNKFVKVLADERLLNSIFENLISNAIKFSKRNSEIKISSKKKGKIFEVRVQDFGVGMGTETVENLFNIDFNSSTHGTEGETGTGLGLILCKDMIETMQGSIRVESAVDKGTSFYVTLPMV